MSRVELGKRVELSGDMRKQERSGRMNSMWKAHMEYWLI
jgi:hypothetical protein